MADARKQEQKQAPPPRMGLASIRRDREVSPPRLLVAGTEGVGKSTFAAGAPSPVFLGPEDGTGMLDVARFPTPTTWADVLDALDSLDTDHEHKTIVLDTVDWIEPLVWKHVVESVGSSDVTSIEDFGYGKGYVKALDEWRRMLSVLERLRTRGMATIMLAHTHIKAFKSPDLEPFDRYEMKLNTKAGGLLKEWSDAVLFAAYETVVKRDERNKRFQGVDTGARFLHTTRQAAYDAKNRYSLPERLPLSWADFAEAMTAREPAKPDQLIEAITAALDRLAAVDKEVAEKGRAGLKVAGTDAAKLAQLNDWANGQTAKRGVAA